VIFPKVLSLRAVLLFFPSLLPFTAQTINMFVFCCKNLRFKLSLLEKKISYTEAILITPTARDLHARAELNAETREKNDNIVFNL